MFSGLRLSTGCIALLEDKALREGVSKAAVISEVLEEWARESARGPRHS
jgi:hypothetical protein